MFGVKYETWSDVCQMYFDLGAGSKGAYLQWFPFAKLSDADKKQICSKAFFEKHIKTAKFILYPKAMHHSENYLQKGDGSFRESVLLSPILYLLVQSIGTEISNHYVPIRDSSIDVFYAGNLQQKRAKYKQDYDSFCKLINTYIPECTYFIKTDIASFFSNVNIDILLERVDAICNKNETVFTPIQLRMIKEVISYCGSGRFPTIENSVASSFLATVVYLDEIDDRLNNFINKNIKCISSFKIIRYVDDMYILITSDCDDRTLNNAYNQICNEYSSILKEHGLSLNIKKCCLKPKIEINEELKKSLYDEYYNGVKCEIENLFEGTFQVFLSKLLSAIHVGRINSEIYNDLINKCFHNDNVEFSPAEVFNYFIYEKDEIFRESEVVSLICQLLEQNISFISLDPKRLTIMIIKTKSEIAIKTLLKQLFSRSKNGLWNSYDTSIAISYLIQSQFKHIDLLNVLGENDKNLKTYYDCSCRHSFLSIFNDSRIDAYVNIIGGDWKTCFLYFMYCTAKEQNNALAEFAFYKTFFDRFTADMEFVYNRDPRCKKPNYKGFYKENSFIKFYDEIPNAIPIINKAHQLRNSNPLIHSTAELIDEESSTNDLKDSIKDLSSLIDEYIKEHE